MRSILRNKRYLKIISSLLIILTIFTFSVVLATGDSVYVWSSQAEPLSTQTSTGTSSDTEGMTDSNSVTANEIDTNIVDANATNSVSTSEEANGNKSITTNTKISSTENNLNLESGGAILIEQHSGQILYEHNSHEKLRPASVTKVMSILLIMEALESGQISLTDKVPCTEDAASMGGSQIWLDVREELTVDEMLKAICVVSANDCTVR